MYDETGLGQAYAVDEPWYIVHSYNNSKPILKSHPNNITTWMLLYFFTE